jgi:protein required for attachment to host cells
VTDRTNKQTKKEKRTHKISFRLSELEYARVKDELEICGMTVSALARRRILGQKVASRADLAVLAELRRLGGLLKHVHNETLGTYSVLTAQAIRDLSAYARVLSEKHTASSDPSKEFHR